MRQTVVLHGVMLRISNAFLADIGKTERRRSFILSVRPCEARFFFRFRDTENAKSLKIGRIGSKHTPSGESEN